MFIERRRPKRPRILLWVSALLVMVLIWDMGRFAGALEEKARNTLVSLPSVDLIAVLTGGQGRMKEAFRLLENAQGRFLLISGTGASLDAILEANDIQLDPIKRSRIFMDPRSQRTFDNAVEIVRTIEETQSRSVLVVTSNYHMQRSLDLIQEALEPKGMDVVLFPYPVQSPNFDPDRWWKSFDAWRIFLSEYIKSWWAVLDPSDFPEGR